jgi:four helix bundle protein
MATRIRTFMDLEVWQAGMDLVVSIYAFSALLPTDERFGLCAPMRRAAVSVPSNVAEGHAFRTAPRAYRRHIRIALGSFAELETHLELSRRLYPKTAAELAGVEKKLTRTGQLLHGLLRALRQTKDRNGVSKRT